MAICNLLTLTLRQNQNYESEALTVNQYCEEPEVVPAVDAQTFRDTMSINGRVMDIMGNMTDEQIEAVMKIGYNNSVEKMVEIITTCQDITDEELIDIFLNKSGYIGATNPTGAPQRLRIVRKSTNPTPTPDNPSTPDPSTPSDPSTVDNPKRDDDGDDEDSSLTADYTLERKCRYGDINYREDIDVDSTGKTFKLTNSVKGKNFKYTISAYGKTQSRIEYIEFLDNDRLLIVGDNLKIVADGGQADNIILMGSNNYVDTGDRNDTVRVGIVKDSYEYYAENYNSYGGNVIMTGSGDDYVENAGVNQIDMGDGNHDYYYTSISNEDSFYDGDSLTLGDGKYYIFKKPKNYEIKFGVGASDNKLGWGSQGNTFGDCQFLSCLNSLANKGSLANYVTIKPSGNNYTVTFIKSNKSVTVTPAMLAESENATGDIDFRIVERAFRYLIEQDGYHMYQDETHDQDKALGTNANNFLISKYLFGDTANPGGFYTLNDNSTFQALMQAYKEGRVSQIVVGTHQKYDDGSTTGPENGELGIYYCHAYAVKDCEVGKWVEVTNPWDGNDIIKLDWIDFFKYFRDYCLFGNAYTFMMSGSSASSILVQSEENIYYGGVSSNPFANIFTDDEPSVYDEISEITDSIENVKQILEEKKTLELYS